MRYYFLVMIWLVAGAGCASPARNTSNLPAASPVDVNSFSETAFDKLDEELSQRQVTISDPLESSNRVMYSINDRFYFGVAKPIIQTYENIVPRPARMCIGNFFKNLTTPARFVNCLFQGKGPEADRELCRFGINTTAGVLGFGDPAHDRWGLEPAQEDLGSNAGCIWFWRRILCCLAVTWPINLARFCWHGGRRISKSCSIRQTCGGFNRHICS